MLICTVIGYKAGLPYGVGFAIVCGFVATLSFLILPFVLTHTVSRLYGRFVQTKWHGPIQHGFAAIILGLLFASSAILARGADHTIRGWGLTGVSTLMVAFTKINPLAIMAVAGVMGWLGWVG